MHSDIQCDLTPSSSFQFMTDRRISAIFALRQLEKSWEMIQNPMDARKQMLFFSGLFPMNPELEDLLKAWDAYLQAGRGEEAEELLADYEIRLEGVCARTKLQEELLDRAVQRAY